MNSVDERIKTYWQKLEQALDFETATTEKFIDPDSTENSMRASEFLMYLDIEPIMHIVNKCYAVAEGEETYPRRAMVKLMFWRRLKGIRFFTETYSELKDYPGDAANLGLVDKHGNVIIPNYRTMTHFENVRLGKEGMNEIFAALRSGVVKEAKVAGVNIGESTAQDAIPVQTRANDEDGKWNAHYKKKMVKLQVVSDVENFVPLAKETDSGNSGDDGHLVPMMTEVAEVVGKENMDSTYFDGGYNSHENLAKMHVLFDFDEIHYHIDRDWKTEITFKHERHGKIYEYTPQQEINRLYSKMWKEPFYGKDADLRYKMECLVSQGICEPVSAYFRNSRMREYEECPDGVLDAYHKRNVEEGFGGYLKEHYELEKFVRGKGMEKIDRDLTAMLNVALAVALTRLQNGVTKNLISIAYLT